MRVTINLPDDLLRDAKRLAANTDQTLTSVIEDSLRAALRRKSRYSPAPYPVHLTTYGRRGTLPGIDLDDSASLADQ